MDVNVCLVSNASQLGPGSTMHLEIASSGCPMRLSRFGMHSSYKHSKLQIKIGIVMVRSVNVYLDFMSNIF